MIFGVDRWFDFVILNAEDTDFVNTQYHVAEVYLGLFQKLLKI